MVLRRLILALVLIAPLADAQTRRFDPRLNEVVESQEWPEITTAAELQSLSSEEAASGRRVKVQGVVTCLNGPLMFLQDDTGGVCVFGQREIAGPREPRPVVRLGATVEVRGISAAGRGVPYVTHRLREMVAVDVLSTGTLPVARPVKVYELATESLHAQWVEVEATVRSVRSESVTPAGIEVPVITLGSGADRVDVVLLAWPAAMALPTNFIGGVYRLRGVFNCSAPERQQNLAMRLLVPARQEVRMREPATPPFELPLTAVAALDELLVEPAPRPHRPRVQGAVTLLVPGKGFFIEAEDAGVWIDAPKSDVSAGDQVDVAGFLGQRGWSVVLEDAIWRVTGKQAPPAPPLLTAEQAFAGQYDARRVMIEALVLSVSRLTEGPTLVLQSGEKVFLARLAVPSGNTSAGALAGVRENSWVRVTGICVNNLSPEPAVDAADDIRPVSFHLLLGPSPEAIEIIRAPSWWTLERVLVAVAILALVTLAAFAWVVALRRRVHRQTRLLREHIARETAYEERVRIARELHDSVGQDLLGISMQLNATEKLLTEPERARRALGLATAMVRRSQVETHRAVWDLREDPSAAQGLVPKLREALAGLQAAGTATFEVHISGTQSPLSAPVENHVLRIALEAVTNALKHAAASSISIELVFTESELRLRVADDGKGFDAQQPPPVSSGHFGLFGMRERAEKLGGELKIDSAPGKGTQLELRVPIVAQPAHPAGDHADSDLPLTPSLSPR